MPPTPRYNSMTLGEYPKAMVRVVCSRCDRKGQYRKLDGHVPSAMLLCILLSIRR
jgi:hypothetical protein